jgi:hypothetical protein
LAEGCWRRPVNRYRGPEQDLEVVSNPFQGRDVDGLCRAGVQQDQRVFKCLQCVLEAEATKIRGYRMGQLGGVRIHVRKRGSSRKGRS